MLVVSLPFYPLLSIFSSSVLYPFSIAFPFPFPFSFPLPLPPSFHHRHHHPHRTTLWSILPSLLLPPTRFRFASCTMSVLSSSMLKMDFHHCIRFQKGWKSCACVRRWGGSMDSWLRVFLLYFNHYLFSFLSLPPSVPLLRIPLGTLAFSFCLVGSCPIQKASHPQHTRGQTIWWPGNNPIGLCEVAIELTIIPVDGRWSIGWPARIRYVIPLSPYSNSLYRRHLSVPLFLQFSSSLLSSGHPPYEWGAGMTIPSRRATISHSNCRSTSCWGTRVCLRRPGHASALG